RLEGEGIEQRRPRHRDADERSRVVEERVAYADLADEPGGLPNEQCTTARWGCRRFRHPSLPRENGRHEGAKTRQDRSAAEALKLAQKGSRRPFLCAGRFRPWLTASGSQTGLQLDAIPRVMSRQVQPERVRVDAERLRGLKRDPLDGHGERED